METKITYTGETLKLMSLFESITRTQLKDCFVDDNSMLTFIVVNGDIGKAIGKDATNVRKLESMLNRKIKIVEFNPELLGFIRNLIYPLRPRNIVEEDGIVTIESSDSKSRGLLIGRNASSLRNFEAITKKYYSVLKEIKVI
jgi:transcription termination/antitermination protein NusA